MKRAKTFITSVLFLLLLPANAFAQAQASPPTNSADILKSFHTIYVRAGTWLSKPEMLQGALQKHPEFDQWGLTIVSYSSADVTLTIDHQPGWFYYTYNMTHPATGIVVAAGKVSAWDGNVACNKIADEIIKRVRRVRPVPKA